MYIDYIFIHINVWNGHMKELWIEQTQSYYNTKKVSC